MRYDVVTKTDLEALRPGLLLLERVLGEDMPEMYLYGLTSNESMLAKAQDQLAEESEDGNSEVKLSQVAVAIRISADSIYYLLGSGWVIDNDSFAYSAGQDNIRTSSLYLGGPKVRLTDEDFTEMAVSESDTWLDDFMAKHSTQVKSQAAPPPTKQVQRNENATKTKTPPPNPQNPIDNFLNS